MSAATQRSLWESDYTWAHPHHLEEPQVQIFRCPNCGNPITFESPKTAPTSVPYIECTTCRMQYCVAIQAETAASTRKWCITRPLPDKDILPDIQPGDMATIKCPKCHRADDVIFLSERPAGTTRGKATTKWKCTNPECNDETFSGHTAQRAEAKTRW